MDLGALLKIFSHTISMGEKGRGYNKLIRGCNTKEYTLHNQSINQSINQSSNYHKLRTNVCNIHSDALLISFRSSAHSDECGTYTEFIQHI